MSQILYQVTKKIFSSLNQSFRYIYSNTTLKELYPLEYRRLLRVGGKDASVFLQGLITNDMRHFDDGTNSMYAMFLNNKGRVLYDTIIYKWDQDDTYMIECDKDIIHLLQKYLKMFKLKRIVEIVDVSQEYTLHAFISNTESESMTETKRGVYLYKDPRIGDLGFRVISSFCVKEPEIAEVLGNDVKINHNGEGYRYLRYKLGVSEGAEDLPPGSSFPLEANCDYLHGVSFHKGCYIGQELTARVHHTGVVRKRIMPVKFTDLPSHIENGLVISASTNPKSNLGKLRGSVRDYGLGLIRTKEALDAKVLTIGNYIAEVVKPTWWPHEAPKDKATIAKLD